MQYKVGDRMGKRFGVTVGGCKREYEIAVPEEKWVLAVARASSPW